MSTPVPKIDARTAAEIAARLAGTADKPGLLEDYTHQPTGPAPRYPFDPWQEYDPLSRAPRGRSAALIGIFARFAEILIERLNRVPEKNFLAFLDLLGAERQPPQPARVPLTFTLAAGSAPGAEVPAGTRVAAPPPPGAKEPVVFETERALAVTTARLDALLTLDPGQDTYGDWSGRDTAFPIFQGERALEHILYLGVGQLLAYPQIKDLSLDIELATPSLPSEPDARAVQWGHWDGTQWQLLEPTADATANLTRSGTIHFGAIPALPELAVNGRTSRWLRCRLLTPITPSPVAVTGMVRAGQLPKIERIIAAVHLERTLAEGVVPDLGFTNGVPLDLGKEFYPFGERPRLHDTLFLASAEAFSKDRTASLSDASAHIEIEVALANSHLLPDTGSVRPSPDLALAWECWSGSAWQPIGASATPPWLALIEIDPAPVLKTEDQVTFAILQGTAQSGAQVTSTGLGATGGTEVRYLSVGADGRFADKRTLTAGVNVFEFGASYAGRSERAWATVFNGTPTVELAVKPPSGPIDEDKIELNVAVTGSEAALVKWLRVTNGNPAVPPEPPQPPEAPIPVRLEEGRNALLVEGLDGDGMRPLAATTLMIGRRAAAPAAAADGFSDGTFALTQSGVVTLRLPDTMAKTAVNGQEGFWLRVRILKGDYGKEASYTLKDPVRPEDGFTLVPASFRAPIVAAVKIGYEVTPRRSPEVCLAYNQLASIDHTLTATGDAVAFAPFVAAAEAQRPGLYLGFSLPAGQSRFPGTTLSLYHRLAEPRYGERAVPLSPETSVHVAEAGAIATHSFLIANAAAQSEDFDIALLGYSWPATVVGVAPPVTLAASATQAFEVQVTIPANAEAGDSDQGFVRIGKGSDPGHLYGATFATGAVRLASAEPGAVAWQYWDGTHWSKLAVQDDSDNFTRSGLLELLPPADLASRDLFGRTRYWLRVEWDKGAYPVPPRLEGVLLNTTLAVQATTLVNEVLGSGNGAKGQQFKATRTPVLAGQGLEVRELELPSAEDLKVLKAEEGDDAVTIVADATGRPQAVWVRWHEVPDFYGSGPRDRHYVINHLTGEIRFGDGVNGRVPPPGSGNLRLAHYRTGGGTAGNSAVGAVAQLKTTVPYVDKAVNPEAAAGGAEAETNEALVARMPRSLRHRDRAVTLEDYEDLALLASTEVARARCVPLRNLAADPLGNAPQPGAVSVILVPRTDEAKPLPTLELLARVETFLAARAPATASPAVVGPLYLRVEVHAEIALVSPSGASGIERALYARLAAFLHPLTGGLDGTGWDFGRAPHRSDFFALIESVPGVDHVRYLQVTEVEDEPGVRATGRFLVYSGTHRIDLVFVAT